ncbi:MAG TPA: hypothetical protein VGF91_04275 [Solirubrobacteraceae bacterium]
MCILCYGLTGEEHWTDARVGTEASTSLRARRRALLSQLLEAHGLDYSDDTTGVTSLVSDRKGAVEVARSLGEVWAAAEKLAKHPLDPLEPALIERLAGETPPA